MDDRVIGGEHAARLAAGRRLRALVAATAVALLGVALTLAGLPSSAVADDDAKAASPVFSGVDFMQSNAEAWEVLRADNLGEAPVYLDVDRCEVTDGDPVTTTLLGRVAFDPREHNAGASDADGAIAQIIALSMEGKTPRETFSGPEDRLRYEIRVYGERRGGDPLFEATVYPVFAQLQDGGSIVGHELLGIRTVKAGGVPPAQNIGAGLTFYREALDDAGNVATEAYVLPDTARDNGFDETLGAFIVPYEKQAPEAVKGSVRYVAPDGEVVREVPVANFVDGRATVRIETSFLEGSAENPEVMRYFRVISNLGGTEVTLTAANAHAVVRVIEVPGMAESDYAVSIRYVDENGALLWSDKLDVKGFGYQYTLPTTFSMRETDGVELYTLEGVEGASGQGVAEGRTAGRPWGHPTITFDEGVDPARDFSVDENGGYYLTATYLSTAATRAATLTLVAIDGSTGERLPAAEQPAPLTVTPDREARFTPAPKVIDGTTYVPWSGNAEEIVYRWESLKEGVDLLQYVYYVPEGYAPAEAYDVTVQYLDIATSAVLRSETVTIKPDAAEYVNIVGEERFSAGGNDYVRLAGQEGGIRHGYYTPTRTYTVYYRDVNDTLNADVVIRRTQIIETERIVEVGGPVTTTLSAAPATVPAPGAASAAGGAGGAGAAGAAGATVDAGVTAGDGSAIINDDDNPLANQAGRDTATERAIEDAETPLGSGADPVSEESPGGALLVGALGLGAVVLAAGAAALIVLRRRASGKAAEAAAGNGAPGE